MRGSLYCAAMWSGVCPSGPCADARAGRRLCDGRALSKACGTDLHWSRARARTADILIAEASRARANAESAVDCEDGVVTLERSGMRSRNAKSARAADLVDSHHAVEWISNTVVTRRAWICARDEQLPRSSVLRLRSLPWATRRLSLRFG